MHLPPLLRQIPITKSTSHLVTALFNQVLDCPKTPNGLKIEATEFESLGHSSASDETVTRLPFPPLVCHRALQVEALWRPLTVNPDNSKFIDMTIWLD